MQLKSHCTHSIGWVSMGTTISHVAVIEGARWRECAIHPTQRAKPCLLSWLLATAGCATIRIQTHVLPMIGHFLNTGSFNLGEMILCWCEHLTWEPAYYRNTLRHVAKCTKSPIITRYLTLLKPNNYSIAIFWCEMFLMSPLQSGSRSARSMCL